MEKEKQPSPKASTSGTITPEKKKSTTSASSTPTKESSYSLDKYEFCYSKSYSTPYSSPHSSHSPDVTFVTEYTRPFDSLQQNLRVRVLVVHPVHPVLQMGQMLSTSQILQPNPSQFRPMEMKKLF